MKIHFCVQFVFVPRKFDEILKPLNPYFSREKASCCDFIIVPTRFDEFYFSSFFLVLINLTRFFMVSDLACLIVLTQNFPPVYTLVLLPKNSKPQ